MKNKFQFLSLTRSGGKAQFTMMMPFGGQHLSLDAAMREAIFANIRAAAAEPGKQTESLGVGSVSQAAPSSPANFETLEDLQPKEADYIYRDFRAISAAPFNCYGLDFSKPGVLKASTPLLANQTVYKDHIYWSVDRWIGVISESAWDEAGAQSEGVAGINVKLKLDWKKDPWTARGLLMEPPAIHSFSVTVLFEFDYSHPDLVEEHRFWSMLGEEVNGQVVRLIVTKIIAYWEGSLVFQGADEYAKQLPGGDATGASQSSSAGGGPTPQQEERTTVKLTAARKQTLGITAEGEDFPDEQVLVIVDGLASQAAAGLVLLTARRAECLRVAKLATLGSEEGELTPALKNVIERSQGEDLEGLITMYTEQAADKFPTTCQSCQRPVKLTRSSVEGSGAVEQAGGIRPANPRRTTSSVF
ncbi:MAG TPA: hypothetical protein VD835_07735 [Pyrinomonadaceae bacterium]|nr:hypothetical protein [Pyrinomonadaceae bacterium]